MSHAYLTQREKIPTKIMATSVEIDRAVAAEIATLIRQRAARAQNAVLGLPTGSTPLGVYAELIRLHKEEGLTFKNVITFNLDEYYPMQPNELQSYRRFMNENLFDHIDIPKPNTHILDGTVPMEQVPAQCAAYEQAIIDAGGIDIQMLGIGRSGHVGFNEPGSSRESRTRLITLDSISRQDAASSFFGEENVPRRGLTMGVGTILTAGRIILMAFGEHKAAIIARAIEGEITPAVAASFLQAHPNAQIFLDDAAASELTRFKHPWLVGPVKWDKRLIRRAVTWIAVKLGKPFLKLTTEDYNENGLQDLVAEHGPAYDLNIGVFRMMMETITGWPGGKPDSLKRPGDIDRPTDAIFPKRCLIFSPHPDDDVIAMGGTQIRLADQEHEVHVAYQTSGNLAVFDADAIRFADFASDFNRFFGIAGDRAESIEKHIEEFLKHKKPGQADSPEVQRIKGLIRRGEARAAGRDCGIPEDRLHFLDMPFYETGKVRKKPVGEEDIKLLVDLMEKIKPHQIYCAGDLSDPHGTHRTCL
ncbi:MAG: glucosamine-6-phosphate deaminase, partial [Tepidisphaeraceae bacterium]